MIPNHKNKFFFKRLVKLLREETSTAEVFKEEKGIDSLDVQVDKYFAQFESESKDVQKNESFFFSRRKNYLFEADEDEKETEEDNDSDEDADDDEAEEASPGKLGIDSLDPYFFANGVARLIENYDTMLEIKNCLVRRSLNYIRKSYKDEVVDEVKRALADEHGLETGRSRFDREAEEFAPPSAERGSGPGSAGGGT
jgi:hypothetical protein